MYKPIDRFVFDTGNIGAHLKDTEDKHLYGRPYHTHGDRISIFGRIFPCIAKRAPRTDFPSDVVDIGTTEPMSSDKVDKVHRDRVGDTDVGHSSKVYCKVCHKTKCDQNTSA